jgi:hypothetical protein
MAAQVGYAAMLHYRPALVDLLTECEIWFKKIAGEDTRQLRNEQLRQ